MKEKELVDLMNEHPILAGAVLPFLATFGMMVILGGSMWLIQTYLDATV